MRRIKKYIRPLVFISVSFIYATTVIGQESINQTGPPKRAIRHCLTKNEIWNFANPHKKRHAVLTIFGIEVNDTLSIRVGDKILLDHRVYSLEDKMQRSGLMEIMTEEFFVVYYSNNKIKHIYNSENWSEYCVFERGKNKSESYEVEITYNGETSTFFFHPTARWHFVFFERGSKKAFYSSRKYFTGLD